MAEQPKDKMFLMQQAYATLVSLANKLQIKGDAYIEGMTTRQLLAMIAIVHLPEDRRTLNNIARKLGTSKQNVKQIITSIESKGYIDLLPSERDNRSYNVKITDPGMRALLESYEKGDRYLADVFSSFSSEELEMLWSMLKRLYSFDGEAQDGFEVEVDYLTEINRKIMS